MFLLNVVSSECIPLTFSGETNPIYAPEGKYSFHDFSFFSPSHGSTEIYDEGKQVKHLVLYFLWIPTI